MSHTILCLISAKMFYITFIFPPVEIIFYPFSVVFQDSLFLLVSTFEYYISRYGFLVFILPGVLIVSYIYSLGSKTSFGNFSTLLLEIFLLFFIFLLFLHVWID
jgi:hypothetical protein